MREFGSIGNRDTSSHSGKIGDINIFFRWESEQVILILENCGYHEEKIFIHYQEASGSGTVLYKQVPLSIGKTQIVELPKEFTKWRKFYCQLDRKKQISTDYLDLKELVDKVQIDAIIEFSQDEIKPPFSNIGQADDPSPIIESKKETNNEQIQISTDVQQEAETTDPGEQEHEIQSEDVAKDDKPIDFVEIENPTLTQKELPIITQITHAIRDWLTELEQSYTANQDLVQTLRYSEQAIKGKLKTIIECEQENSEEYNQFVSQFIKDRLFNGVARFVRFDQLPEQLEQCLQLVDYEIVPIEIGKTQADARVHDIQGSRQTDVVPGTVVEVILPGLRRKIDGEIVQKPVVIRGE